MATERFVKSGEYWCVYCKVPWEVRIVAPPGGCLLPTCRSCGREWNLAASPIDPNGVRAEPAYPERQADVSRSEKPMTPEQVTDWRRVTAELLERTENTYKGATWREARTMAYAFDAALVELTTARQGIAALTRERDEARAELDALVAQLCDDLNLAIESAPELTARLRQQHADQRQTMAEENATLRAQHRAAVEALRHVSTRRFADGTFCYCLGEEVGPDGPHKPYCNIARKALTPASPDTAPVGEAWRLIETAPTDGTRVDLWVVRPRTGKGCRIADCFRELAQWWFSDTRPVDEIGQPTHWQPLPPPPGTTMDPTTCRAQGHGRVACERCGAEWVGLESVRQGQA